MDEQLVIDEVRDDEIMFDLLLGTKHLRSLVVPVLISPCVIAFWVLFGSTYRGSNNTNGDSCRRYLL